MIGDASLRKPGEIIYHFDVEPSSIPLAQFVDTARATQEIIDDFNKSLFDARLKYELRVKTPEEGSLIEVLMVVVTVGGSVLAFLGTDIGKAFFKGLTTEEPAEWAEKVGASLRRALAKPEATSEAEGPSVRVEIVDSRPATTGEAEVANEIEAEAIALVLIRFLEIDTDRLKAIGITPEKFRQAFQGRNKVFKGCIDNPEVKGITFDRKPHFEVKRSDFPRRITQLPDPPPEEPPATKDWSAETVDIVVNSPNWKRDGRKWQAATSKHQDIAFSVDDEGFWLSVERRDIQPRIRDNLRVQWAYPAGLSKPHNVRVLRVLSYNGKTISPPLSEAELKSLLKTVHSVEPDPPGLFDEKRDSDDDDSKGGA
jgi:hypothetical protein